MKNFLFVQWKKPTDASRYVIDGEVSEYSATDQQVEIMTSLADIGNFKELCRNRNNPELSPSFRCSYKKTRSQVRYYVEGNFLETDEADRKLVYIFSAEEKDPFKVAEILTNYATKLGVTPTPKDLEEIKKHRIPNNTKKFILWTLIAIAISLLSFTLLNLLSRP
ncbi:MAG: hypothetical protein SOY07_02215 [Bacteroidales bacterium]|nr:hypothetical protein [Bacteroidales bacterium]MDY4174099.1 hypothetical protein [Bacteroidales bacterium]